MSLALDGSASGSASGASATAVLTTSLTNDIVVAVVSIYSTTTSTSYASMLGHSISSTSGLQWSLRSEQRLILTDHSSKPLLIAVWWAHAPTALTSETITVAVHNPGTAGTTVTSFGVNGADLVNPFDLNLSLPAVAAHVGTGGTSSHPVTGISTTNPNTLQISALVQWDMSAGGGAADSGFTLIANNEYVAYTFGCSAEYKALSSPLSSASQNVFTSVSISADYIAYVDAIQAAGTTGAGPSYVNSATPVTGSTAGTLTQILPGSRTNGNVLLAYLSISNSGTPSVTWPGDWNAIETWTIGGQTGSRAWRYVDGTEVNTVVSWTGGSTTASMTRMDQYTGAATINPIGAISHGSNTSSPVSSTQITTTGPNSLVVNYVDAGQPDPSSTPSGFTSRWTGWTGGNGFWNLCDSLIASSGTLSPSNSVPLYTTNTQWLDFQTELLSAVLTFPFRGRSAGLNHMLRR